MSRLFREMHEKWENEPESLTPEEQLERAEFNKQVAEDEYREAKQNVLYGTKNVNINKKGG
jgi:hypothetical protein